MSEQIVFLKFSWKFILFFIVFFIIILAIDLLHSGLLSKSMYAGVTILILTCLYTINYIFKKIKTLKKGN